MYIHVSEREREKERDRERERKWDMYIIWTYAWKMGGYIIFSPWIWVWQDRLLFDRDIPNLAWDKMLCTFLTFDLYVGGGGILSEYMYYSVFYFVNLDFLGHILL